MLTIIVLHNDGRRKGKKKKMEELSDIFSGEQNILGEAEKNIFCLESVGSQK